MAKIQVKSSNIASIDYNEVNLTLDVTFHRGGTYRYFGVEPDDVQELIDAKSIGTTFHKFKQRFSFQKLS